MENKIIEFVREFNAGLENSNYHNTLEYSSDGYHEGIFLPQLCVFSDDNDSTFVRQLSLSSLTKQLHEFLEIANPMLVDEVDKFFAQKKKELQEKFTDTRIKTERKTILVWQVFISGKYNEDFMDQFMDVFKEDFEYIFEGCKLECEW